MIYGFSWPAKIMASPFKSPPILLNHFLYEVATPFSLVSKLMPYNFVFPILCKLSSKNNISLNIFLLNGKGNTKAKGFRPECPSLFPWRLTVWDRLHMYKTNTRHVFEVTKFKRLWGPIGPFPPITLKIPPTHCDIILPLSPSPKSYGTFL